MNTNLFNPLLLKLKINVEPESSNLSINITALNSSDNSRSKSYDISDIFNFVPKQLSTLRERIENKTSQLPFLPSNSSNRAFHSEKAENERINDTISYSNKKFTFTIPMPNTSRTNLPPIQDNLSKIQIGGSNPVHGSSSFFVTIISVGAAAVTVTFFLHFVLFPLPMSKKIQFISQILKRLFGLVSKEKGVPSPVKQGSAKKGTPVAQSNSKLSAARSSPTISSPPKAITVAPEIIDEAKPENFAVNAANAEFIEPTIVINRRNRQASSNKTKQDEMNSNASFSADLQLWNIYPKPEEELMDHVDNPFYFDSDGNELKDSPLSASRVHSQSRSREQPDDAAAIHINTMNKADGLVDIYDDPVYFVDDNPLSDSKGGSVPKKILFPSFVYNNTSIDCVGGEFGDADESVVALEGSNYQLDITDEGNPLKIETAASPMPLNLKKDTQSSGATTAASTDTEISLVASNGNSVSPLKMKLKYPSFLLPNGRKTLTKHEVESSLPLEEDSDDDYGSAIHSYSFSTATFSPVPSSNRGAISGSSSHSKRHGDDERKFNSPKLSDNFASALELKNDTVDPNNVSRRETVSTAPGSWMELHGSKYMEKNPMKRGESFFVRPKTLSSAGELSPEQLKALRQLYNGKNYDNFVNKIDAKDRGSDERKSSLGSNWSGHSSTFFTSDVRSLAAASATLDKQPSDKGISLTRHNSQLSNVSALSVSSGSSGFLSNTSRQCKSDSKSSHSNPLSQSVHSVGNVSEKSKPTSSGEKIAQSAVGVMRSPEKTGKKKDFFRCISPCKAVHYIVHGSPQKQLPANASDASLIGPYSSKYASKSSAISNNNRSNTGFTIESRATGVVVRSNNLLKPGSSMVRTPSFKASSPLSSPLPNSPPRTGATTTTFASSSASHSTRKPSPNIGQRQ